MTNPAPRAPISISRRYKVEQFCGHCSAPLMLDRGKPCGVYVDDTTPERRHWIEVALEHHPPPQMVFVGIAPFEDRTMLEHHALGVPHVDPPHLVRLREWLPWGMGSAWRDFGKPPPCGKGNGYILQWWWFGESGHQRPNIACRNTILRWARQHKPRFIFLV